ncbi:hypothetical protein [Microbacterium maritypicum]
MAWPTVTVTDVENRWRPLTDAEKTVAQTRISEIEAELKRELRLEGITGSPTDLPTEEISDWDVLYVGVIADVVRNSLINPEGWLEEREELDDFARTRRRDSAVSAGIGFLTDDAIAKLLPRRRLRRGSFTIALGQT